jgi:hypothetical protein
MVLRLGIFKMPEFKNNFHGNDSHFEISKPQKVVIHLCVKLSVFAVSMAAAGILNIPSLKTIYTFIVAYCRVT